MTEVKPITEISPALTEEEKGENFAGISSIAYRRAHGDE